MSTRRPLEIRGVKRGARRVETWGGGAPQTVIRADLTVIGDLMTDGHVMVDGMVFGTVNGETVTIGEHGHVEGMVLAETAYIHGTVVGPVQASTVTVGTTARIVGSVFHHTLTVRPGAQLEGRRPWRPSIDRKKILADRTASVGSGTVQHDR